MKGLTIRVAVLSLLLAVAWTAADARITGAGMTSSDVLEKANNLIGMPVESMDGGTVGTISDLVLDRNLNTVSHAVISHRTAREGAQHFAIPFNELTLNRTKDAMMLDMAGARDFGSFEESDWTVSRAPGFQGPLDIYGSPVQERAYTRETYRSEEPIVDIYGRPIEGKARTPYVQNVYENPPDSRVPLKDGAYYRGSDWRAFERDQYGRPLYERNYYVGDDTFGHNGYTVQKKLGAVENRYDVYGRPIYGSEPSRSDWRWGESSLESDYDVYGRPVMKDQFSKPLESDKSLDYDVYGRPIYRDVDRYGRPLDYDRYGRPMARDTWRDRDMEPSYGTTGRDMSSWFRTDWNRDSGRLGLRSVSNLIGTDLAVRDRDAGNIEDLMIDMREGHIAYVLVSLTDAFAGTSNHMAAIPWQAVDLLPEQRLASVDVSRQQLLNMAFREGDMPDLNDMSYARRLHEGFNMSPYWEVLGYVEPSGVTKYRGTAWGADSWYAQSFDPDSVMTFSGTIESVSTFKPAPDATAGLRLRVRSDDGQLMQVNAGPSGFATQKGISFSVGDRITVTGSRAQIAGQNVILASQLKMGDNTVQLRTRQGQPLW